jgi:hypothetical protein
MADIFTQYIGNVGVQLGIPGFQVLAGRGDGTVQTPYFCVVATEVAETIRGSGIYLGDVSFIVVTNSTDSISANQTAIITQVMNFVRSLSNTICSNDCQIVDTNLKIVVDGIVQMSQIDILDDQAFADRVDMRIGFREVDSVPPLVPQTVNPLYP